MPISLDGLLRLRLRLLQQLTEVNVGIDAFKVKCATCDAMLLPKQKCTRCSEAEMFVEEEAG